MCMTLKKRLFRKFLAYGLFIVISLAVLGAGIYAWRNVREYLFLDNFGVVEESTIYRSGALLPFQLEKVIEEYDIRTLLRLYEFELPASDIEAINEICVRNNVRQVPLILSGDGIAEFKSYDRAVAILRNSENLPALVCCARGVHRTGAVIAAYRVLAQNWPVSKALQEMEKYKFRPRRHRYGGEPHPLLPHLKEYFRERLATDTSSHP